MISGELDGDEHWRTYCLELVAAWLAVAAETGALAKGSADTQ
jgi:hypothetical protein